MGLDLHLEPALKWKFEELQILALSRFSAPEVAACGEHIGAFNI